MSPRQRHIRELIKARYRIDQKLDILTRPTYLPPAPPIMRVAKTGQIASPHPPEVHWRQQARLNQVALEELHSAGYRHISHQVGKQRYGLLERETS